MMTQFRLVLASTSPSRRELLARLGLPFETAAPRFEERSPSTEPIAPEVVRALVLDNARGKAQSLRAEFPDALILASDQLGECEGRVLGKPQSVEAAVAQLRFLAGREHRLHTAVVLLDCREGSIEAEVVTNRLMIRELPEAALRRYVELEPPLHAAGSYISEGLGIALFSYLRGDDPTAIVGLPLVATCRLLEQAGVSPLSSEPEER